MSPAHHGTLAGWPSMIGTPFTESCKLSERGVGSSDRIRKMTSANAAPADTHVTSIGQRESDATSAKTTDTPPATAPLSPSRRSNGSPSAGGEGWDGFPLQPAHRTSASTPTRPTTHAPQSERKLHRRIARVTLHLQHQLSTRTRIQRHREVRPADRNGLSIPLDRLDHVLGICTALHHERSRRRRADIDERHD